MMRTVIAVIVVLCLVGPVVSCDEEPVGPEPGESFTLSVGERIPLDAVSVGLRFIEVTTDSRCPTQVRCMWAGDGAVLLEIAPPLGDVTETTVHTNPESGPRSTALGRYELVLLQLDPYPETPGVIPPEDYRAELVLYERLEAE